jgi:hypothetical protein
MAVAFKLRFRGATLDQYDQIVELMGFGDGTADADGAIFHWVAKTDDGLLVVDVWESDEHFQRFSDEKIGPYSQQVGITDPPEITRHEVHNFLVGAGVTAGTTV